MHGRPVPVLRVLLNAECCRVECSQVDALMSTRGGDGEHEASRRFKAELLSQMDGITSTTEEGRNVMVRSSDEPPLELLLCKPPAACSGGASSNGSASSCMVILGSRSSLLLYVSVHRSWPQATAHGTWTRASGGASRSGYTFLSRIRQPDRACFRST